MENKFLQIKKANNFGQDYFYSERLGKDSVAFILKDIYHYTEIVYGFIREWKPPIQQFKVSAFGGSLDDSTASLQETVIKEVFEEAGYTVTSSQVLYVGSFLASTQSNELVHLFEVHVPAERLKEELEPNTEVVWMLAEESKKVACWKARLIIGV